MPSDAAHRPQLLVSVRNAAEAIAAIAGGCDILDIKDPGRGSLGMAGVASMNEVLATAGKVPVSAALGETRDWLNGDQALPALPRFAYCKLGTAGFAGSRGWVSDWLAVRQRFDADAAGSPNWIAVAYADWRAAEGPAPDEVLTAAVATNCAGLLIDTFAKTGRSTFDWCDADRTRQLIDRARSAGLRVALAGLCAFEEVAAAVALSPDIIAVRTLACEAGARIAPVCPTAVRRLREAIGTAAAE